MSEVNLIDQARRGDQAAWSTLVARHQEAVFRLAYLLLDDPDEANDAAQEAFIRAFQALDRFDSDRSLRPWLLSIVANQARNRRRAMGRYLAALKRVFQSEGAALITPGPGDQQQQQWEARTLWQAIRRLKADDQEIIYLRYFLNLSVVETAEAVEIAPGTVKSRLSRALQRLQTVIDEQFPALREERVG